jgi:hypothetical protein
MPSYAMYKQSTWWHWHNIFSFLRKHGP